MENKSQKEQKNKRIIIEARGLKKHFGGIRAVDDVSFKLYESEILGIVGDNGAGKSTLIKLITGAYKSDGGEVFLNGNRLEIQNTLQLRKLGIETVYQNQGLVENMNAPSNLFLGKEKVKPGLLGRVFKWLDKKFMKDETNELLKKLNIELKNFALPVKQLSGGQQQSVTIARATYWKGKITILDEPANNLGVEEQEKVLNLVRNLRENHNISFIMITHNLEHVFGIADRILVMRNGKIVGDKNVKETTRNEIVSLITGAFV
ncbi:sugar ABC transporter ATP-binding protein [Candidatus Aerophobetes bacterium]|nr:sugar ABC transporter ATP-binding protein [Candidatus Aerophobetes bacterium]